MVSNVEQIAGAWFFKKTEEDGIFVKHGGSRLKTLNGDLTENVLTVEMSASKNKKQRNTSGSQDHVLITCRNLVAVGGESQFLLDIKDFDREGSSFSSLFSEDALSSTKDFAAKFAEVTRKSRQQLSDKPSGSGNSQLPLNEKLTPASSRSVNKNSHQAKRKIHLENQTDSEDLHSPAKRRVQSYDDTIAAHHIGKYKLRVDCLAKCPLHWLDRPIDQKAVEEIARRIKQNPNFQDETQSWLAIADLSQADLKGQNTKEILKGSSIRVIGGRHRQAAYEMLNSKGSSLAKTLEKVWVSVYSNELTDEQIRRLAHNHNMLDKGSRKTKWLDRVSSCRSWLYTMTGTNESEATPSSTLEWRKSCHTMYVDEDKDVANLEPTLQAATLSQESWKLFVKAEQLYLAYELKGMSRPKPSRAKAMEMKQNMLGMPLQGVTEESKLLLLMKLINKELTLKELQQSATSIKRKQKLVKAFIQYTGVNSWEELQKRFPKMATEEKLSQFCTLKWKGAKLPTELENFFQRAVAMEKDELEKSAIFKHQTECKQGVRFFEGDSSYGVIVPGNPLSIDIDEVKSLTPTASGFSLVIGTLPENVEEARLKRLLVAIHSLNIETVRQYNLAFILEGHEDEALVKQALGRMVAVQVGYVVDLNAKITTGDRLLSHSTRKLVIGQWSKSGSLVEGNLRDGQNSSNAFRTEELVPRLLNLFTYEGQWVLDLTEFEGGSAMTICIAAGRNCVSIYQQDYIRKVSTMARQVKEKGNASNTIEEECSDDEDSEGEDLDGKEEEGGGENTISGKKNANTKQQ